MGASLQESPKQTNPASDSVISFPALLRCVSLDLEMSRIANNLLAAAVYRPDTGEQLSMSGRPNSGSLQRLELLAEGALFLLGHKIIAFDIPHLRALNPDLSLPVLPVVDTLCLNPPGLDHVAAAGAHRVSSMPNTGGPSPRSRCWSNRLVSWHLDIG